MTLLADGTHRTDGSAELGELLDGLSRGLNAATLPERAAAIASCQEKLAALNDPALDAVRENLTRLHDMLTADKPDGTAIGHAMMLLGESVETFAEYYDGPACEQLDALGTQLRTQGEGMSNGMTPGLAGV